MQYEPQDSERHIKHEGMTPAKGATTWRTMGISNDKALRLRDEQEGAGTWAGLQSGKWSELDTWVETRSCPPAVVATGLPVRLPSTCLGCWRRA